MLLIKNVSQQRREYKTMADHEVEEEEPQAGPRKGKGKKERNWKDKERTLLITLYDCLWNIVHEDCMNIGIKRKWLTRLTVKSMHRCQRNMLSQGIITKANGKSEITYYREQTLKEKSLKACCESQFIIMRMHF